MDSRRHFIAAALGAGAAACGRKLGKGFPGYAFVANSDGHAVAAVDLEAFAVIRHIRLDADPTQVAASPSQPRIYALAPKAATLFEIGADTLEVRRRLRLPGSPASLRVAPDGSAIWVLCPEQRQVLRISPDRLQVDHRVALSGTPVAIDFAPEESETRAMAAVSLGGAGTVALLEAATARLLATLPLGAEVGEVRFRKDGAHLLALHRSEPMLSQYDLRARRCAVRLPLAVRPEHMCVKPDGGEVYITGAGADALVTVYPFRTEVRGTLLAGRAPGYVAATGARVFVANPESNDVSIVDSRNQRVVAVARVGKQPCFIALTPDERFALVLGRESGDMTVLRAEPQTVKRAASAPAAPSFMIPVGSAPSQAVVWSAAWSREG